ncbi:hypothetical protein Poly30_10170 [Planctomycetes bacterium Poly30]|uniref:Peptidase C-terminal archaeal/bacterial domain-containing protein n=1 Tax=Saltatorellus ferox TaxID=2528018 RepID=A0A518EN65_9BACT|nr:hypothetical protein Poly30_10170 [Planctomycetes bacterium Poly30]
MKSALLLSLLAFSLATSVQAQCPNDDGLGNNTFATATAVPTGATSLFNLVVMGVGQANFAVPDTGNDFFAIEIGPGRTLDVDAGYDFSQVALYLQLYSSGGGFIVGTNPNTQSAGFSYTNPLSTSRTVYLRVTSASTPNGCGDYDLDIRNQACPFDDALEDFDTCQSSFPLVSVPTIELQRLAVLDGDDDWFDIRLQPGERLDVAIVFEHARADIDLFLVDLNGGNCGGPSLASSVSTTDNESVSFTNTSGSVQDIAIGVEWYDSAAGNSCNDYELQYSVTAAPGDDLFEDNDDLCTPSPVGLGVHENLIVFDTDSDFYFFGVVQGERANVSIDFLHADGDLDLRLYDVTNGCIGAPLIGSSDSTSNYEEVSFTATNPGVTLCTLEVFYYPNDGGNNQYELTLGKGFPTSIGETVCNNTPNSTGLQGFIIGSGSDVVSANSLTLGCQDLPVNSFAFFNGSMGFQRVANPGGSQGDLCIAGAPIGRFVGPGQVQSSGSTGFVSLQVDLTNLPQPTGSVAALPGDTWYFQLWYRDAVGGMPVSNFSSGLRVRLQ